MLRLTDQELGAVELEKLSCVLLDLFLTGKFDCAVIHRSMLCRHSHVEAGFWRNRVSNYAPHQLNLFPLIRLVWKVSVRKLLGSLLVGCLAKDDGAQRKNGWPNTFRELVQL